MIRVMTVILAVLLALTAGSAVAQELMHYEGYTHNTSITPPGAVASSTGLVTALYPPLVYDFARFEYTYNLGRLTSMGSTTSDGIVFRTTYGVFGSFFDVFEDIDPTFPPGGTGGDARSTFYLCPSGLGGNEPAYTNGVLYLHGHFVSFSTTYDVSTSQGTFVATVNWDSGKEVANGDLPANRRGGWTFGGTTTSGFSCIPAGYDEALTGRMFQLTTPTNGQTWGSIRKLYR